MDSGGPNKKQKISGVALLVLISMLPHDLLVLIISKLPFRDAMRTSMVARPWRYLYREVRHICFEESKMVNYSIDDDKDVQQSKRADFFSYMVDWISRYSGGVIESFILSVSNPIGFESEIKLLIEFAASRKVKNLFLDFSNRRWHFIDAANLPLYEEASLIQLPDCVYELTSLVNLKLYACRFDPSRLVEPGLVKCLCFGWTGLRNITSLLPKTPLLKMLAIEHCWNVGLDAITGYNNRLTRLVIKNCIFSVKKSKLNLPMIQLFKYSGKLHHFEFVNVNTKLEEVYLDFVEEREINGATSKQLCDLLSALFSAKTLTVCPFLLELMDHSEQLVLPKMRTQRLILKTNLKPREFGGISFMLNSCPYLENLSFHLVTTMPVFMIDHLIDPDTYANIFWMLKGSHVCLNETLKNVEMCNFMGSKYEVQWLTFMIRYGCVLEKVNLYMQPGMNGYQMFVATNAAKALATEFKASPKPLMLSLHR